MVESCMPPEAGSDSHLWLAAAREHLQISEMADVPTRGRCFHAQRAVEMALKSLLLHHGLEVPKVHALERLALLLPGEVPDFARQAAALTAYAVEEMYPDTFTDLTDDHASEAAALAGAVVEWAESIVGLVEP